jgi:hypothetical protein
MQSFFKNYELKTDKPWLIIGKGPSFEKINDIDLTKYYTFGLNEVCQIIPCDIGHFIDDEVLSHNFIKNCKAIVSPVRPHQNCRVSNRYLVSWYFIPYEEQLTALKKLYCYNCSTYKGASFIEFGPTVKVRYFSVEAAFRLLALQGLKVIHTLGIDGGKSYAKDFNHIKPLRNGRESFDEQFRELAAIITKFNLTWLPLAINTDK